MKRRFVRWQRTALATLLGCGVSFAAQAQFIKPDTPPNPNADSRSAMKDTVEDPRIEKALAAHKGTWNRWCCRFIWKAALRTTILSDS
jgi:hypothetical protein